MLDTCRFGINFPDRVIFLAFEARRAYFSRAGIIVAKSSEPESPLPSGTIKAPRDIGAWVRHARKASGLTLAETAALTGVGIRFLHELEHGKTTASLGKTLTVLQRMGLIVLIRQRDR
jgi:hypothetical protein